MASRSRVRSVHHPHLVPCNGRVCPILPCGGVRMRTDSGSRCGRLPLSKHRDSPLTVGVTGNVRRHGAVDGSDIARFPIVIPRQDLYLVHLVAHAKHLIPTLVNSQSSLRHKKFYASAASPSATLTLLIEVSVEQSEIVPTYPLLPSCCMYHRSLEVSMSLPPDGQADPQLTSASIGVILQRFRVNVECRHPVDGASHIAHDG